MPRGLVGEVGIDLTSIPAIDPDDCGAMSHRGLLPHRAEQEDRQGGHHLTADVLAFRLWKNTTLRWHAMSALRPASPGTRLVDVARTPADRDQSVHL